jgi:hypothetical protein
MAGGIDSKYLKDLEQVLTAEADLLRQGTDLLADPEYRALRELFVDGDLTLAQFVRRVENLAATRPDEDASRNGAGDASDDDDSDDGDDDAGGDAGGDGSGE